MKKQFIQLVREWPPGYGGVERVAHEMAEYAQSEVYSLDVKNLRGSSNERFERTYQKTYIHCLRITKIAVPIPSENLARLLLSKDHLIGHLPSPEVLALLCLCKLINPHRQITTYWHAFLESNNITLNVIIRIYEKIALRLSRAIGCLITTSPNLLEQLGKEGVKKEQIKILPCCLSKNWEKSLLKCVRKPHIDGHYTLRIIFIGRLDSYKSVDRLIMSCVALGKRWRLDIAGDGPRKREFEEVARRYNIDKNIRFWGRVSETQKLSLLKAADVLVLPSTRCNEAFGIVQLEAMASGITSLCFKNPKSGSAWVSQLKQLDWGQSPNELSSILMKFMSNKALLRQCSLESRERYLKKFAHEKWEHKLESILNY